MIEAIKNALKVPDLRRRILFTLGMIAIYRFGSHVPVPGVDVSRIADLISAQAGGVLNFLDLFAGGALARFAVFALGIMPYITSTIIMQLLTVVIPTLERWAKEGEVGQKKITQWTRYGTLILAILQSMGLIVFFQSSLNVVFPLLTKFLIVITLTAGTALIMWLGELITQKGIGNGMSLLIFASIVSRMPVALFQTVSVQSPIFIFFVAAMFLVVVGAVIFIERGQRRIPVQYAKRIVGRKMYGGQATYIPLKVNTAGVIPIIFASSLLLFPAQIAQFTQVSWLRSLGNSLSPQSNVYIVMFAALIIFFTYFYTAIAFNPIDLADNIKKYGGFVPGVRPGKPTASYLDRVLNRITLPGSFFLATIAILPTLLFRTLNAPFFEYFGGTSLLIIVSVALETMTQLESQLVMRNYEGFFK
ncbi:MAG: preprotein translocase subunit SecY [Actinobacteria bacterium]|nr:MAG: preprotein translocase subunit SecY [Actinomycetota bacterium]